MPNLATIVLSHDVARPVEDVWRALTEPYLFAKWWAPGDVAPVVGHKFTLEMGAFGAQKCTVLVAEPNDSFVCAFGEGTINTTVSWRLTPTETGTHIEFEHAGFDLDSPVGEQPIREWAAAGRTSCPGSTRRLRRDACWLIARA